VVRYIGVGRLEGEALQVLCYRYAW
jgi:hypothetical protein